MQQIPPQPAQRWFRSGFQLVLLLLLIHLSLPGLGAEKKAPATSSGMTDSADTAVAESDSGPKEQAQSQIENSMANIEIIQQTLETLRTELDNSKEDALLNRSSLGTIKDGLELIDSKLKEAYSGLDESRNNIAINTADITKLKTDLLALGRDVRTNASDIDSQKSLIEGNATRLYEILITIADLTKQLDNLQGSTNQVAEQKLAEQKSLVQDINRLWILLAIILVSMTPLAYVLTTNRDHYKPLPDGTPQHQGVLLACLGVFLGYFTLGFGLMFGVSANGWIGVSSYLLGGESLTPNQTPLFPFAEFALYQAGFALLAALIVYSAIGRQLSAVAHLLLALFVGVILVPVFGHWAWAGQFIPGNKGWLEAIGFMDAAGSTTINAVAAWFAFALAWKLGQHGNDQTDLDRDDQDAPYSSSAVLFLWLGWLGFATGTLSISNNQIAPTMLNISLAAASAGISAFLHYSFFHTSKGMISRALGGFVTGLVAVAASASILTVPEALLLGVTSGLIHNMAFTVLRKHFLSHASQARVAYLVAIHGAGGIWGSLCVALLGSEGTFALPDISQLISQAEGIAVALIYSMVLARLVWVLLAFRQRQVLSRDHA